MKIEISKEALWKKLALFAWRKWRACQPEGKMPAGVPNNRDPDFVCKDYEPRPRIDGKSDPFWCRGDGHYLCEKDCIHYRKDEDDE